MSYRSEVDLFRSGENNLNYRFVRPLKERDDTPAVLFLHGAASPKGRGRVLFEVFQDFLAGNGISSLAYDTRGVGESEGEYTDSTLDNRLADAEAAYGRLIKQTEVDVKRLAILGLSMGGHPEWFKAVILVNPAAYAAEGRLSEVMLSGVPHTIMSGTDKSAERARRLLYIQTVGFFNAFL